MTERSLKGRIFNHFDWGGYLLFTQWPRMRVFVDGRNETVYPLPVLMDCLNKAQKADPAFIREMARRAEWALWPTDHPTTKALYKSGVWDVDMADGQAVLFRSRLLNPRPEAENGKSHSHDHELSSEREVAVKKSRQL